MIAKEPSLKNFSFIKKNLLNFQNFTPLKSKLKIKNSKKQWSSRCALVYTSVHEKYFSVHRKIVK